MPLVADARAQMSNPALIVTQSGRVTPGLQALVTADGYDPVSTLVTNRPEHGTYHLSPATIEQIEERSSDPGEGQPTVVVDGRPHPGQLTDLQRRLHPMTVVDASRALWDRLAEANPVAATRLNLRKARLAHRQAADAQRAAAPDGPSGTSGRLADTKDRMQALHDTLDDRRETAQKRVVESHTDTDGRIVLLGRIGAPTTALWSTLTGVDTTAAVGRPAQATTATTTVGPHQLAVTDTPGIPGASGLPEWLLEVIPGTSAALETATCVLGVGEGCDRLLQTVTERFETPCRSIKSADATVARTILDEFLDTATYAIQVPYGDDAHALVSELHDRATVHAVEYDDAIYLRVEVSQMAVDELCRRVHAVNGDLKSVEKR